MQENNQAPTQEDRQEIKLKKANKRLRMILLWSLHILVIIALSLTIWYLYSQNSTNKALVDKKSKEIELLDNTINGIEKELAGGSVSTTNCSTDSDVVADDAATTTVTPSATTINNIETSITSGNTQALEGYLASSVNVVLAATEAYGVQTPSQAVSDVTSFIKNSNIWVFDLGAATTTPYTQGSYSTYFPDSAIVGKSNDGKVISFSFNSNGEVNVIFMANSENLLQ